MRGPPFSYLDYGAPIRCFAPDDPLRVVGRERALRSGGPRRTRRYFEDRREDVSRSYVRTGARGLELGAGAEIGEEDRGGGLGDTAPVEALGA